MSSDQIKIFDFEDHAVRTVIRDVEPWFVAADVCRVLDIANPRDAVSRLDDDERGVVTADTLGGKQEMTIVSESGLYALIFTSRKEAAKRFRKWVTSEVLPAIRRTGSYTDPGAARPRPDSGTGDIARQDVSNWLSMVREARLLRGPGAAIRMWERSPLPPLNDGQPVEDAAESDPFPAFIAACCEVTGRPKDFVRAHDLIKAFQAWSAAQGDPPMPARSVAIGLRALAGRCRCPVTRQRFTAAKSSDSGYRGLRLVTVQ